MADRQSGRADVDWRTPTPLSEAIFEAKAAGLRLRRGLGDILHRPERLRRAETPSDLDLLAGRSTSRLWSDVADAERDLELGKVHNLRQAARRLDGLLIPARTPFSFWRQVGSPNRRRGYVNGRMLREGCLVASTGGGLCQLSNALYQAALEANCDILERHRHSRIVPGSAAEAGNDATVAWNYVDLRFAADRDLRLGVGLDPTSLTVSLYSAAAAPVASSSRNRVTVPTLETARSCGACGETECHRHRSPARPSDCTAFVVDGAAPEFRAYVTAVRQPGDLIAVPLDGRRWGLRRYAWATEGFEAVLEAPLWAARRALAWRTTPQQGPARREAEVRTSAALAAALGRRLPPGATHLVIAQSLAPYLWRLGHLGGRSFDILMGRLPIAELQARLDAAFAIHPERRSLADYRAPAWLAAAEAEVLAAADRLVTPHAEIGAMFGDRAVRLDWATPAAARRSAGAVIGFPGPTVARKGAFEVREAIRTLGLALRPLGAELEGEDFWNGIKRDRAPPGGSWLGGLAAVVQPALVEESPRALLAALAAGAPVIATPACGLRPQAGLTLIEAGDPHALVVALAAQSLESRL